LQDDGAVPVLFESIDMMVPVAPIAFPKPTCAIAFLRRTPGGVAGIRAMAEA
jgi:hypothetical protein